MRAETLRGTPPPANDRCRDAAQSASTLVPFLTLVPAKHLFLVREALVPCPCPTLLPHFSVTGACSRRKRQGHRGSSARRLCYKFLANMDMICSNYPFLMYTYQMHPFANRSVPSHGNTTLEFFDTSDSTNSSSPIHPRPTAIAGNFSQQRQIFPSSPDSLHKSSFLGSDLEPTSSKAESGYEEYTDSGSIVTQGIGDHVSSHPFHDFPNSTFSRATNVSNGTNIETVQNSSLNPSNLTESSPTILKMSPKKIRRAVLPFIPPEDRSAEAYMSTSTTTAGRVFFGCRWKACCGLSFWEHAEARNHIYNHFLQKGYECACGANFATELTARRHYRKQLNTYVCPGCAKAISRKDYLKTHQEKCKGKLRTD
ncbi:hypothetical protein M422DRAFT_245341 [Sphaerobolus stellatus SS14]|nr:hypothetical protein M422DRAFT_245341 [Sphaerobolus stellatus SS14]